MLIVVGIAAAARDLPLVVFARGDDGWSNGELRDALQHVFRGVGREVGDQLFVDCQVRREDKEIVQSVRQVEIADEGAHEPRLADARRQREAQAGELSLEVRDAGKLALNGRKGRIQIGAFTEWHDLRDPVQDFKRLPLRGTQAKAAGDRIDMTVHLLPPLFAPNRSGCCDFALLGAVSSTATFGDAFGRFSTFRL